MQVHVLLWALCLCTLAYFAGVHGLTVGFAGSLIALLVGAVWSGVAFGAIANALNWRRQRQLRIGDDAFDAIWASVTMAISAIFLALTLDATITSAGWRIPHAVLLLTPICTLLVWAITAAAGGESSKKLKLRLPAGRSQVRTVILLILFGLAVGCGAEIVRSALVNMSILVS